MYTASSTFALATGLSDRDLGAMQLGESRLRFRLFYQKPEDGQGR